MTPLRTAGVLMGAYLWTAPATAAVESVESPAAPETTHSVSAYEPANPLALRGHGRPKLFNALGQAAKNYGSDLVYLYTSPIRMSGKNVVQLDAVAAVGGVLYAYDGDIYSGFQRSREDRVYDAIVIDVGGFFEPLGLIGRTRLFYEGAAVAGWVFDVPLLRTIPVEILESNTIVAASRQAIERLVGRERPSDGHGPRSFKNGDSFPSGHTPCAASTRARRDL